MERRKCTQAQNATILLPELKLHCSLVAMVNTVKQQLEILYVDYFLCWWVECDSYERTSSESCHIFKWELFKLQSRSAWWVGFISDIISTSEASWLRMNHLVSPNVLTQKEKCAKAQEDELSKETIMLQIWHRQCSFMRKWLWCQKSQTGTVLWQVWRNYLKWSVTAFKVGFCEKVMGN